MKDYEKEGIKAHGYLCDVTDKLHVQKLVINAIEKTLGTIDILVNNAGIIKRIPMCDMTTEEFRQVVDIDLVSLFIGSKAAIPGMIKKGHGKIINICSMMSELGRETVSAYAAAKGGLKMFTRNICPNSAAPISSAMALALATSQRLRQPRCAKNSRMASVILSTSSSSPRRRLAAKGSSKRPRRTGRLLSFPCFGLRKRTHFIRRRRYPSLHRKATVNALCNPAGFATIESIRSPS